MRTRLNQTLAAGVIGVVVVAGVTAAAADPSPRPTTAAAVTDAGAAVPMAGMDAGAMAVMHRQMPTGSMGSAQGMGALHDAMDGMHSQMVAGLPDDQRAAMDAMHTQMHDAMHSGAAGSQDGRPAGHDAHHPPAAN
jgi:hypothetical protein